MKNSPTIKKVIGEFLLYKKEEGAYVKEISEYVQKHISLNSKTPRNSVFSVLTRMENVQRFGPGKYRLISTRS